MADAEDRTEAPSQQRLQKAREDGQIALSREAMSFVALLSGTLGICILLPHLTPDFVRTMKVLMLNAGQLSQTANGLQHATEQAIITGLKLVLPIAVLGLVLSLGAGLMQTGFLLHPASLLPKISRISPMKGLTHILGGGTLPETLKALIKLGIFTSLLWHFSRSIIPTLRSMPDLTPAGLLTTLTHLGWAATSSMLGAHFLIAGGDIFWVRFRHLSKLKMSREELKEEYKNAEGDPHIKGRLKAMRARRAKQRMMEAVKTATVIVTNPTHYSVALLYEKGSSAAPKIVAKGVDDLAARIRETAQDHRIPLVSNPPLARALYPLPLDSEIPAEHFKVVAAIIAYVWKLRKPANQGQPVG